MSSNLQNAIREQSAVQKRVANAAIVMGNIYCDDLHTAVEFYRELLQLPEGMHLTDSSCYFPMANSTGLFIESGYPKKEIAETDARTTFTIKVDSAKKFHTKLVKKKVRVVQMQPMQMSDEIYWFQFFDPAGNLVEILGGV